MITDNLLTFSDKQNVAANAVSDDIVDLGPLTHGNTERDIGVGEPLYLVVAAQSGFNAGTLRVEVKTGLTDTAVTTTIATSPTINCANVKPGETLLVVPVPRGCQQFLQLNYIVAGATGELWAGIVKDAQQYKAYATAFEVL